VSVYAGPVQDLIDELGRLPGVGPKSAQRIAFHLLKLPTEDALRIATAIAVVKERVSFCTICFNVSEGDACGICSDTRREARVVCVVEEPRDIVAVEKTGEYRGRYHVLQGAISPIEGIGPDQLRVKELLARIEPEGIEEVILCTNPNIEGEATNHSAFASHELPADYLSVATSSTQTSSRSAAPSRAAATSSNSDRFKKDGVALTATTAKCRSTLAATATLEFHKDVQRNAGA